MTEVFCLFLFGWIGLQNTLRGADLLEKIMSFFFFRSINFKVVMGHPSEDV